jgi:hypothetical protein
VVALLRCKFLPALRSPPVVTSASTAQCGTQSSECCVRTKAALTPAMATVPDLVRSSSELGVRDTDLLPRERPSARPRGRATTRVSAPPASGRLVSANSQTARDRPSQQRGRLGPRACSFRGAVVRRRR